MGGSEKVQNYANVILVRLSGQKRKVTGSLVGKIIRHKLNTIAYETPSMTTTQCLYLVLNTQETSHFY